MFIRNILRKLGFDIVRYPYKNRFVDVNIVSEWRKNRFKLLRHYDVDLILDVGANDGHFGLELRQSGYQGQIISFEPLKEAFAVLQERSKNDPSWKVYNFAIGDTNSSGEINVSGNSQSSSILEMGIVHQENAPESKYKGKESIEIRKLDDFAGEFSGYKNIYLKLDVQGYEDKAFKGFELNFPRVKGVQLEMSLVELYSGEKTFFEHSDFLLRSGFKLVAVEPGFYNPDSGQLLQVDGIWYR